jgi:hypothetical protein
VSWSQPCRDPGPVIVKMSQNLRLALVVFFVRLSGAVFLGFY